MAETNTGWPGYSTYHLWRGLNRKIWIPKNEEAMMRTENRNVSDPFGTGPLWHCSGAVRGMNGRTQYGTAGPPEKSSLATRRIIDAERREAE